MSDNHEMILDEVYPSGAEMWSCPICGRKFVMQWPPSYKRIILNEGNSGVVHNGGKGGLKMGGVVVEKQPDMSTWSDFVNGLDLDNMVG